MAVGFLWLFLTLQIPRDKDEDKNVKAKLLSEGTEDMGEGVVDRQTLIVPVSVHREQEAPKGVGVDWDPLVHKEAASPLPAPAPRPPPHGQR